MSIQNLHLYLHFFFKFKTTDKHKIPLLENPKKWKPYLSYGRKWDYNYACTVNTFNTSERKIP